MKKLRIGYYSLSKDLSHPGDRRRIVFWVKARSHDLLINPKNPVDVVVVSEKADMQKAMNEHPGVPVVLDLIDGYLAREPMITDYARGISKVLTRQLGGFPKSYTKYTKQACFDASAVICSTPEQKATIAPYSPNVHIILDSHDELPLLNFQKVLPNKTFQIMWEGMPYTLSGIKQAKSVLYDQNLHDRRVLKVITDPTYRKFLGKYLQRDTFTLLAGELGNDIRPDILIPWSIEALVSTAKNSNLAIIPINLSSPLQLLKPENRLLIMWRLGLPCLTSATSAYKRVSTVSGIDLICDSPLEWAKKSGEILSNSESGAEIINRGQSYLKEFHSTEILLDKWDKAIGSVT